MTSDKRAPQRARRWDRLAADFPDVAAAYEGLRTACDGGPLAEDLIALVKLAVSVGARADRTMHAHTRKALRLGLRPETLRHVALVALPTIGLPAALEALKRIDQSIAEAAGSDAAPAGPSARVPAAPAGRRRDGRPSKVVSAKGVRGIR